MYRILFILQIFCIHPLHIAVQNVDTKHSRNNIARKIANQILVCSSLDLQSYSTLALLLLSTNWQTENTFMLEFVTCEKEIDTRKKLKTCETFDIINIRRNRKKKLHLKQGILNCPVKRRGKFNFVKSFCKKKTEKVETI